MPEDIGKNSQGTSRRISVGPMSLITIGVLLLLQTTGVIPWGLWHELWRFWPAIIIVFGVNLLLGHRAPRTAVLIIMFILIGSVASAYVIWDGVGEPLLNKQSSNTVGPNLKISSVDNIGRIGE